MAKAEKATKKKAKTVKRKSATVTVPSNRAEAAELLSRLGTLKGKIDGIQHELNERMQKLADEAEERGGPLVSEFEATMVALENFATEHKEELLSGDARSFTLANGGAGWREHPPRVNIKNTEAVLTNLEHLGLSQFIRTVKEIDKEAMLADPARAQSIDGVSITSGTTFYVRLAADGTELTKAMKLKVPKPERS